MIGVLLRCPLVWLKAKKMVDKRQTIKERDIERELRREGKIKY